MRVGGESIAAAAPSGRSRAPNAGSGSPQELPAENSGASRLDVSLFLLRLSNKSPIRQSSPGLHFFTRGPVVAPNSGAREAEL